jgi:DNA-binding CsgD family transcriptional regulator
MPGREGALQAARKRMLYTQPGARDVGPEIEAADPHRRSGEPIASGTSLRRSRGGLEVVPGGGAAREGPRPLERNPQETPAAFAPVRDGSLPRAHLLWAAAALLLEVIADDAPGDLDAFALDLARDLASGPVLPPGEPAWPGEPLTAGETRVLRYLPSHLAAPGIAAELSLSANTVKTHLRHLYRKLGAHSRQEAVQRARAIGLLTGSSRWG